MNWVNGLQSDTFSLTLRLGVSAGMFFFAGIYFWALHRKRKSWQRVCSVAFTLLAVISAGAYVRFGAYPWIGGYNAREVFHYYLGTKYHAEVGYEHLYPCAVLADQESEQLFRQVPKVRNATTQRQYPREDVVADGATLIKRFTAARWQSFKADVTAIVGESRARERLLTDLGFVASPFWISLVTPLTAWVGANSGSGLGLFCSVDYLLLLLTVVMIWRTFGWTVAMVAASFAFTSFAIDSWTVRGSILRMDWLAALVGSVCCLHAGRHKLAGGLAAFSILVRGFPLLFFLGLGVQVLADLLGRRRIRREHASFFGTLILSGAGLALPSLLQPGGVATWRDYVSRMSHHSELVRVKRVGFSAVATYGGETSRDDFVTADKRVSREAWSAEKQQKLAAIRPWLRIVTVMALVIVGGLSLRLTPQMTAGLGVLAIYFTVDVSWYYYIVLWVPCLIFSARLERWPAALAVMILSAGNFLSLWIEDAVEFELRRYVLVSWVILFVLVMTTALLWMLRDVGPAKRDGIPGEMIT